MVKPVAEASLSEHSCGSDREAARRMVVVEKMSEDLWLKTPVTRGPAWAGRCPAMGPGDDDPIEDDTPPRYSRHVVRMKSAWPVGSGDA